ncbi:MAG TPA: AI-2E family transporter, partial [Longimicrobium sp.]|nr:AI-2E family transporter [Longimicrobium sp.]
MAFLHTQKQRAAALVVTLGVLIVAALLPFASGLLGVAVLYVICAPAHRWLSRRVPPRVSALLVLLAALALICLPGATLLGLLLNETPDALRSMQNGQFFTEIAGVRILGVDVGQQLADAGGALVTWVSSQAFVLFGNAARGALSLLISFFGVYYLLVSPGHVWPAIRDFLPFPDATAEALRRRFLLVTEATLLGTILTAMIQGMVVGLGFWAVGLDGAVFWGFITGLASVLPVMGSALVWAPATVVLLLTGHVGGAAGMLAVGGIAGSVDNFVRLYVFKAISNIHPMATLVGAFAGFKYFGILGVLLGPLGIAYFFELL